MIAILFILVFLTQHIDMYQVFAIGSFGVIPNTIICGILYISFVFVLIFGNMKFSLPRPVPYSMKCFFIVLIGILLSGLYPLFWGNSLVIVQYFKTSLHFYFLVFFTFLCFFYPISFKTWNTAIKIWLVISIFVNIFGIYQIVARAFDLPFAWLQLNNISLMSRDTLQLDSFKQLSLQFQNFFRATSFFSEPSYLAIFNGFTLIFLVVPYVQSRSAFLRSKFLTRLTFISSITAMFLTFSLTGLLAVLIIILLIILIERREYIKKIFGLILIAMCFIVVTDSIVSSKLDTSVLSLFEERISGIISGGTKRHKQISGESFTTRVNLANESFKLWKKSPLFGVGLGTHQYHHDTENTFGGYSALVALGEGGVISFIGFCGMFFFLFYDSYKLKKRTENLEDNIGVRLQGLIIYIMAVLFGINFFTTNSFVTPALWHTLGLCFSILYISRPSSSV